jgi:hypothetical protein
MAPARKRIAKSRKPCTVGVCAAAFVQASVTGGMGSNGIRVLIFQIGRSSGICFWLLVGRGFGVRKV